MDNEYVLYSDYVKPNVRVESSIVEGLKVFLTKEFMLCPSCGFQQSSIEHNTIRICEMCGLKMKRAGNTLFIIERTR